MRKAPVIGLTFAAALVVAVLVRGGQSLVALLVLFIVFGSLERWFALRPQKTFRRGIMTDLTHFFVDGLIVGVIGVVVRGRARPAAHLGAPLRHRRGAARAGRARIGSRARVPRQLRRPSPHAHGAVPVALPLGAPQHRADGLGRVGSSPPVRPSVHPGVRDRAARACSGYGGGAFAGVAVFFTLLALFQHANVRLRFPGVRWVINTPEWHHWHHPSTPRHTTRTSASR